jgi:hypothetical protein
LLDITHGSPRINTNASTSKEDKPTRLWRYKSSFVEVKPTEGQGPVPSEPGAIKEIVSQAADYARLHMSARPFQLFSIGLLIFGSKFCVAIFDRDGIRFSPVRDIWDDVRAFMRVIHRLACDMSPVQLGQDPTIRIFSNTEAAFWQERANGMQSFPTYAVTMGVGNRYWYTLGPPIWSSLSLLGQGTAIWRVCDSAKPNKLLVLNNAWRSSERLAESTIYQTIRGVHPGVAGYEFGADVVFPDKGRPISVRNLRDKFSSSTTASTPILHRLFISTIGRPLWDYNSDLELLAGIRSALKGSLLPLYVTLCRLGKSIGHHFLYDQGILHRDVSAGNILLSSERNPQPGREGFIMDVEYAHITRPSLNAVTTTNVAPVRGPGGIMTTPMTRTPFSYAASNSGNRPIYGIRGSRGNL